MTKLQKFRALTIVLAFAAMCLAGCDDSGKKVKVEYHDLRSFPTAAPVNSEGHSGQNF